jgi:hypothetical protein
MQCKVTGDGAVAPTRQVVESLFSHRRRIAEDIYLENITAVAE